MEQIKLIPIPIQIISTFDDMEFIQSNLVLEEMHEPMFRKISYRLRSYVLAEEQEAGTREVTVSYEVPVFPFLPNFIEAFPEFANPPTEARTKKVRVSIKKRIMYPNARNIIPELGNRRSITYLTEGMDEN